MQNTNKLKLIYALQKYYLKKAGEGYSSGAIYNNIIKLYPMSRVTFYSYMSTPLAGIKEKIDNKELKKFVNNVIESLQRLEGKA